jgi:acyl-CoA reductase-like NAD-dependent aldehyde dehydrogenase
MPSRERDPEARIEVRKTYKLLINGEFVRSESGRSFAVSEVNVPRASRKDLRDSVRAARTAFSGWAGRAPMNRGQVLYRAAEMLDARRQQFIRELGGGRRAGREVDAAVAALIWYAGWTDKIAQVFGTVNPVAGPYFNFTIPEPTGVVGVVAPETPALAGLVARLAPALAGGNSVIAIASDASPLPALTFGEVITTSDFPPGVVNLLTGRRAELLPWLGAHMDVNAIDATGCSEEELRALQAAAAANVKRVVHARNGDASPIAITDLMEFKTVWHPIGT